MPQKKRPSRQDIMRDQQRSTFVGRVEHLETFEQNLVHLNRTPDGFGYPKDFLFNVWGQGGVGKTTLLRRFEDIAKNYNGISARIDEAIASIPEVMAAFAKQLTDQGQAFPKFSDRYKVYRQKKKELETDPEAPQGFSAFMGKTVAQVGLSLGRRVPGADVAIDFMDEKAVVEAAGEWSAYVTRKLKNKDEVQLVNEPEAVLTPLFLEELGEIFGRQVVLLFDTYERTGEILETWLLDIVAGQRYGELPSNCIWVIAGRDQLNPNHWSGYDPVQFPVEPFTTEEATQFLHRKGVTNPQVVEPVLEVSGRLPLLLAILAENALNDPEQVGEASSTAVERFLKWVDDPAKRALAMEAALPQSLNRDVVACLVGDEESEALFGWLKGMPFVRERSDGWAYHDVVRPQMLRYQQRESEDRWVERHRLLADYYGDRAQQLGLNETVCYSDSTWQNNVLNQLYHRLCGHPQKELSIALKQFLEALEQKRSFAQRWADVMLQAGQDTDVVALRTWGDRLAKGLKAYDNGKYVEIVAAFTGLFTELLKLDEIEPREHSSILCGRGEVYRLTTSYKKALVDFNKAIELNPEHKWAIAFRGNTYRLMRRYEEALTDYSRAIELDPENRRVIARRGDTYRLMRQYEESLTDFNRAIELDPNYSWAICKRGQVYLPLKQYGQALQNFKTAIDIKATNWRYYCQALAHLGLRQTENAQSDLNQAVQMAREDYRKDSDNYRNAVNLALYYIVARRHNKAKQLYQKVACKEAPLLYIREAISDLQNLLTIFPNYPHAQEMEGFLQSVLSQRQRPVTQSPSPTY